MQVNYVGTRNLIETIYELGEEKSCAFVDVGTAAETGDRMPPIHWGRVGDPHQAVDVRLLRRIEGRSRASRDRIRPCP